MMKERLNVEIGKTSNKNKKIINDYWKIDDDGNFVYRPSDIKNLYDVSIPKIRKIITENSKVNFNKGTCECGKEMIEEVASQQSLTQIIHEFKSYDLVDKLKCKDCQEKELEEIQRLAKETLQKNIDLEKKAKAEAYKKLEYGLLEERWKELSEVDFDNLLVIARSQNRSQVFGNLFQGKYFDSPEGKEVWRSINRLENYGLIWVKRNINGNILEFIMLDELKEVLIDYIKSEDTDYNNSLETNNDFENEVQIEDTFRFVLRPNGHMLNNRHPNFSGKIKLDKHIVLEQGKDYRYGAWLNNDGSIYVKILPADEPFVDAKENITQKNNIEDIGIDSFDDKWEAPY